MAETTVKKLADVVGIPVDTLLTQMKEAGLPHTDAGEGVSDEQKQQLLAHLRKSHGAQDAERLDIGPVRVIIVSFPMVVSRTKNPTKRIERHH